MSLSLAAHHARVLSRRECEHSVAGLQSYALPALVEDDGETFRLVEIADKACALRREWLTALVECRQQFKHCYGAVRYLAQAEHVFKVLLISGDDRRRIYAILRDVRTILPGKVVVVLLNDTSPELSADLLNRGADDILHLGMPAKEAIGRLCALVRRADLARGRQMAEDRNCVERRTLLRKLSSSHLTPMEERILEVLAEREGRVVPYRSIASRASLYWEESDNMRSLKVTMCRLRRKLAGGAWIETQWGRGYALRLGNLSPAAAGGTHAA